MKPKIEDIIKIIDRAIKNYSVKPIKIQDKVYNLHIFSKDEDINLFEGFLFSEVKEKSELSYLTSRYRAPVSGYVPRLCLLVYNDQILIKDYRRNKLIRKTIEKINQPFISKLNKALSEPNENNFNKLFDRTDIIEEFYILYKKSRDFLLKNIKGISGEERREEFVDNFMMQMLTLWYLQERGFFNNDTSYLITKFKELEQKKLFNGFNNYYAFLTYFFDKIGNHLNNQYYEDKIVGKVVVVGPAIFLNGEHDSKAISIPDKCFYKEEFLITTQPKKVSDEVPLLNLFESKDWTEGNIDEFVLGAIYEKLITYMERKRLGAYYTPEEITSYICKNTIEPYLIDRINEKFDKNFESIDQIIEDEKNKKILSCLFAQLKEIKILDPAVGSAHFLESAINVLVSIYEKIWNKTKELGIKRGLDIIAADEHGRIKTINLLEISDEEQFKLYVKFFIILSKNIYGVDINPSALKVAKARLFLTLAKHFDIHKNYFIRFPNVHFNLREGNSLIGYVQLEKEQERVKGQLALDLFVKKEEATYVSEAIKIVTELKEYLIETANALGINGNIVKEIEELNKILSKKGVKWNDFEFVLRTKEKLIRILTASLNSQYARPLNELLNQITELFNHKLDEKFAKEYNIDLGELKKIKTFHWVFEFPEVFLNRKGFDVVVGNPPYGGNIHVIEIKLVDKCEISKPNIAKAFILRGYDLTGKKGYMSLLSPKSLTYASDWFNLRKFLISELLEIYDVKEAFKDVLLEQVFFISKRGSKVNYYLAKDFFREDAPIKINKGKIEDTLLCDLTNRDFKIVENIKKEYSLAELIHTWRGLPFQRYIDEVEGDEEIIIGKNIGLYTLKNDLPRIKLRNVLRKFDKNIKNLKKPKLVFQNIVAFISQPVHHIKVMGTYEDKGRITLDTVNNIELKVNDVSPLFFLGLMNSVFFNWLLHRVAFNRAVRTMHLDNYALRKIPIPPINKETITNIESLVKDLLINGYSAKKYFMIEDMVLQLYEINLEDMPTDYIIIRNFYKNAQGVEDIS